MAETIKHLGASWEQGSISFVESAGGVLEKAFQVPFEPRIQTETKKDEIDPWEKKLAADIKGALKENKITNKIVNLSLPTNDIIFRSFVIPWMQQHEIQNVVEFEIGKYIPFSLSELSYAFHPLTINIEGIKNIRIIFVAIKLDALENYERVFKTAGLQASMVEPSALSLIRTLSYKKIIPDNETVAMIEKGEVGKIIVSDRNIPQFVREFHLSSALPAMDATEESLAKKLSKEVRISLDYFNRQNEQLSVNKIFFLSGESDDTVSNDLQEFLGIPITLVDIATLVGEGASVGAGVMNAYGSSLTKETSRLVSFNLSKNVIEDEGGRKSFSIKLKNLTKKQWIAICVMICAPALIASIALSVIWKQNIKKERTRLTAQLGLFKDSDVDYIKKKENLILDKLKDLKGTRIKSEISDFMVLIPEILPDEVWLKNLSVTYYDYTESQIGSKNRRSIRSIAQQQQEESKPTLILSIEGYAYSENKGEQIQIVNTLVAQLKENQEIKDFFQSVELDTFKAQSLMDFDVTYFKIACKQTNETDGPE